MAMSLRPTDGLATRLLGLPPVTTDYTVSRGIRVPMGDGVELAADLYQPRSDAVGTLLIPGALRPPTRPGAAPGEGLRRPRLPRPLREQPWHLRLGGGHSIP